MLLLVDLDGTVYTRSSPIDGAVAALADLRAAGHVLRFLTNTDSHPTASLLASLVARGVPIHEGELFTSVTAAEALLAGAGDVRVLPVANEAVAAELAGRFPAASASVTHVVVGDVRSTLSYELLDAAFRALRAGAELVAMQKGRFYLDDVGAHIDTGAIVAALEFAAGVPATVVGKPSVAFLELAARSAGRPFPPDQICVVGDDVLSDIRMGRDAGARTVLVRTGKYPLQRDLPDVPVPDHEIDSLAALPALVRRLG